MLFNWYVASSITNPAINERIIGTKRYTLTIREYTKVIRVIHDAHWMRYVVLYLYKVSVANPVALIARILVIPSAKYHS